MPACQTTCARMASRLRTKAARMGEVLVGTCSWTDPTLIRSGRFYPAEAKSAEARLQFYASQFRLVEVDSSYYSLPAEQTAVLWAQRTGPDFVFDVKAFRLFTQHPTPLAVLPKDILASLPPSLQGKTSIYQRDLPGAHHRRALAALRRRSAPAGQRRQAGHRPLPVPALVPPRRRAARVHPVLPGEAAPVPHRRGVPAQLLGEREEQREDLQPSCGTTTCPTSAWTSPRGSSPASRR